MSLVQDHEHDFVPILIPLCEMRERCRLCTAIRIVPNPGDSDAELSARIMLGAKNGMPEDVWFALVARMMQRQYERETGLPAFAASQEYATWLKNRKGND